MAQPRLTPLPRRGLYVVTDPRLTASVGVVTAVEGALAGGARLVQYRNKDAPVGVREREVRALLAVCRDHGVPLVVNDDVGLAARVAADGVHVGRDDEDPARARGALPGGAIVGVSCYDSIERAARAEAGGADYVAFGSFFASPTKPAAARPPLSLLGEARARLRVPVVAIGGITAENAGEAIAAGADLLAVVHGVFGQGDVEGAARAIASRFD